METLDDVLKYVFIGYIVTVIATCIIGYDLPLWMRIVLLACIAVCNISIGYGIYILFKSVNSRKT